ncbi:AimR family lysis-lysogeny pheromone receptor [Bacillus anthracis]|uniref:AimR family lysis-lysogeny pheromone receptor n=1 Tax=Bacillus anthracis TaxID=1392 RepID=UPI003D1BD441
MNFVKKSIDDYLSERKMSYEELASMVDVAQTPISNWINSESEISITTFCKIVQKIFPEQKQLQEEYIIDYLSGLKNRKVINIKIAFLISYLNRYRMVLDYLIRNCKEDKESCLKNYAKLFELYSERLDNADNRDQFLELETMSVTLTGKKQADASILIDILKMLILLDLSEVSLIRNYRNRINTNINHLTNTDQKELIEFWLAEIDSYQLLREDKLTEFRKINSSLKVNPVMKYLPTLHGVLESRNGESYIFTNYKKSFDHTTRAIKIFEKWQDEFRYQIASNNLSFLKLVWERDINTIDVDSLNTEEKVLYYIKMEKEDLAMSVLNQAENDGKLTPLMTCFKGMLTKNRELIRQSINMFIQKNDRFFVKFAEMIYNRGDNSYVINVKEESI